MDIFVNVANQKLRISTYDRNLVDGTQKFVRFIFDLSDDWDGLRTFAQFRQGENAYNQYLDENNCVYLPAEIKAGTCTLMLYGSSNSIIGTTNYLTLAIDENILVENADSTEISESLYNQLVTKVSSLDEEVNQLKNKGIDTDLLEETVEAEMKKFIDSGALANMTIEDGSVSRNKVDTDFEATLQNADNAMQPNIYDSQGKRTDIFDYVDKKKYIGNWDQNDESGNNYIQNRPLHIESGLVSIVWDGQPTDVVADVNYYQISENVPDGDDLVGGTATVCVDGINQVWPISAYYKNASVLETDLENITDTSVVFVVNAGIIGKHNGLLALVSGFKSILGIIVPRGHSADMSPGIYAGVVEKTSDDGVTTKYYIAGLDYEYSDVVVDDRYRSVLKRKGEANVFVVDIGSTDITAIDYSSYQIGDVILVIGDDELAVKT